LEDKKKSIFSKINTRQKFLNEPTAKINTREKQKLSEN